jgi:hypothetical protein
MKLLSNVVKHHSNCYIHAPFGDTYAHFFALLNRSTHHTACAPPHPRCAFLEGSDGMKVFCVTAKHNFSSSLCRSFAGVLVRVRVVGSFDSTHLTFFLPQLSCSAIEVSVRLSKLPNALGSYSRLKLKRCGA